jgi:hypothetical protein
MKSSFEQPTAEQVTAYALSIGFKLDGEAFCDYYISCGWVIGAGKKPMKDWQSAVRFWKRAAAPNALFDPQRAQYSAAMQRRTEDERYLEEYAEQLRSIRSWKGQSGCPFGDPDEAESRLLEKARLNFGADFVSKMRGRAK